jgi:3',5'-cyclic AMP phosphodiesterase CpdA
VTGCASDSASGTKAGPRAGAARGATEDFFFLQVSDTHWGFSGPMVNPESETELPNAVTAINQSALKPDFIVFTGDLTHTTDDVNVRRQRMQEFQQITAALQVELHFMPGEHDAAPDAGATYREQFGPTQYSFDHKGIHFIVLDNVSDAMANLGAAQLEWLRQDLASLDAEAPIVVFCHRPLWNLKAEWDWNTPDGQQAIDLLLPFDNVTVFFGHIHQELHHDTGHISHHSARSLMFALPTPETPGMRTPIPWDPDHPNAGLGYRSVEATTTTRTYDLGEIPVPET